MTRTAAFPATARRDVRLIDATRSGAEEGRDQLAADRIAARLARYATDSAPAQQARRAPSASTRGVQAPEARNGWAPDRQPANRQPRRQGAKSTVADVTLRAGAIPHDEDALRRVGEDAARRIEASIASTLNSAVAALRNDMADVASGLKQHDAANLRILNARLEALEAAGPEISSSISRAVDARIDAVDDHLADLTRSLTQHHGWDLEDGLSQIQAQLDTLTTAVRDTAMRQISRDVVRQIVGDAISEAPAPKFTDFPDLETDVTQPILAAIDAAFQRFEAGYMRASENTPPPPQAHDVLASAVRDELASARAGQSQEIRSVESRLGALQDSVSALTEQLRISREASERADMLAHNNAMAVAGARPAARAEHPGARINEQDRRAGEQGRGSSLYTLQVGDEGDAASPTAPAGSGDLGGVSPSLSADPVNALPRATPLLSTSTAPSVAPSPAASPTEIRSRLIFAARRANATQPNQRRPASGEAGHSAAKRKTVSRWLRGKGLLWGAALVVVAGATPLLAPALRALPGALLPQATDAGRLSAERQQEKIGSHLTASSGRPGSIVNDPTALYALGDRIAEGSNVGSPKLAASLLEKAAERGHAPAQYRIARLYERGSGVTKDVRRAREWYARAADQGNVRAMHNLAVLYADGSLGSADYATASTWFRKAAERGLSDSQYNLGVLLARGLGGQSNPSEAWKWFDIGARSGDQEAGARRDEVASRLSPDDLAAVKATSAAWRAVPVDALANDPPAGASAPSGATAGAEPAKDGRPV